MKPTANSSVIGQWQHKPPATSPMFVRNNVLEDSQRSAQAGSSEWGSVVATFLTTLAIFFVFLVQGIIIARILGPLARGEFGTSIYFARDVLLYAGLLGGIEIINAYAARGSLDSIALKYQAARLGLLSGIVTACVAAVISVAFLMAAGKFYLAPFALVCCLFVPWEHMHLTVSAVDRGTAQYSRYNFNRLFFSLTFPLVVVLAFGFRFDERCGISPLLLMCGLFVFAKILGLLPTLRGMNLTRGAFGGIGRRYAKQTSESPADNHPVVPDVCTLLREGRPYALSMFASELFERLDILLIVSLATVEMSGYYFVAVPAAALLTIAPNALGVFTFNAGADHRRQISVWQAVAVMAFTALLQLLATGAFALIMPTLIEWMYGKDFAAAIPFAMWLLPACAIKGFLQAADGYLKGRGKAMIGVRSRVISIFVMLGFVAATFSRFELVSIPMAACAGQAVSMILISVSVIMDIVQRQSGLGLEELATPQLPEAR